MPDVAPAVVEVPLLGWFWYVVAWGAVIAFRLTRYRSRELFFLSPPHGVWDVFIVLCLPLTAEWLLGNFWFGFFFGAVYMITVSVLIRRIRTQQAEEKRARALEQHH